MRAFALLLAACATNAGPMTESGVTGVIEKTWIEPTPTRLDVLFVIDSSQAMQPYEAQLAREMRLTGLELGGFGRYVDLHIGVITGDLGGPECARSGDPGALRRSPLVYDPYLWFRRDMRGTRTNTSGSVVEAAEALGDVGATGCARNQPLEAMRIALDHDPQNAGFRRSNAHLAVIVIAAADDVSPGSLADYTSFLLGVNRDVVVEVVGAATERLRAFSAGFPNRGSYELIDPLGSLGLVEDAYYTYVPWEPVIFSPCLDAPLVDTRDDVPGVQPECSVTDTQQVIPRCGDSVQFPCWRVTEDAQCPAAEHLRIDVMRGDFDPPDNNVVVAQCVSR